MSFLQAILLGIIQGFTEFLPVSSSGHLILAQRMFGLNQSSLVFDVVLHLGTLVPVFIVFWKDIVGLIMKPFQKLTYLLIAATIPAVLAALLFGDTIEALFEGSYFLLGVGFIITGILLMYSDGIHNGDKPMENVTYLDAAIIGIVQAIAITPAISRSGSTISASLFRNLTRETAARFSFLLSIPAILGAAVLQIIKIVRGDIMIADLNMLSMLVGFIAAMLSGLLAIRFMLALIKKCKLRYFSYYVFVLALFIFIDSLFLHLFLK